MCWKCGEICYKGKDLDRYLFFVESRQFYTYQKGFLL